MAEKEEGFMPERIYGIVEGKGGWYNRVGDPTDHTTAGVPSEYLWAAGKAGDLIIQLLKLSAQRTLLDKLNCAITNTPYAGLLGIGAQPAMYIQNYPMSVCYGAKKQSLDGLASTLIKEIGDINKFINEANWIGSLNGFQGYGRLVEQFYNPGPMLYAYNTLQWQTSIIPRMRRHWLSTYTPTVPDSRMAWSLFRRGKITDAQFETYASYDGWDKASAELLRSVWKNIPNENAAFRMFARGKITSEELEKIYYANSWEKEDFDKLNGLYEWLPNAREAYALLRRGKVTKTIYDYLVHAQGYLPEWAKFLPKAWERLPMPHDAFHMMMRGAIKQKDFEHYVDANEWEEGSADKLIAIYQNLLGARDAFKLFKRGALTKTLQTFLYSADGYMEAWQPFLSKAWERIPHPKDAFNAFMRGKIDRKAFDKWVESNEWFEGGSDFLYDIYTRLPSIREAFYMWAKGIIDTTQRDQLYLAAGYDKEWHGKLTENEYYIPTVYDLTRIADFVEIDSIWATKILKERGVRDRDITKILAMLKIRPLRDEIRRQIALWVYRYRMGWASAVELEAALQAYLDGGFIQSTEKDFTTQEAELNYEDELMYEKIQIYSWYFKTAVISEEELLQDFLDLGIREEKANLMVEGLKAQGYYGYY